MALLTYRWHCWHIDGTCWHIDDTVDILTALLTYWWHMLTYWWHMFRQSWYSYSLPTFSLTDGSASLETRRTAKQQCPGSQGRFVSPPPFPPPLSHTQLSFRQFLAVFSLNLWKEETTWTDTRNEICGAHRPALFSQQTNLTSAVCASVD